MRQGRAIGRHLCTHPSYQTPDAHKSASGGSYWSQAQVSTVPCTRPSKVSKTELKLPVEVPAKIRNIRTIAGPNVYSHQPVLVMRLDLQDMAGRESNEVPGLSIACSRSCRVATITIVA